VVNGQRLRAFFLPERGVVLPWPYALVATAGIALGVALAGSNIGQRLEWQLYDQYARRDAAGREPAPDVVVVAIDELSFAEIGMAWPWPHSLHAALTDQLAAAGARSIAFDIVFDVPAPDAADDEAFATALTRAGNVILGADQAVIEDRSYTVTQWSDPVAPLARAASAIGAVRIPIDPDFVLRRADLQLDGRPSLAMAVAGQEPEFNAPAGLDPSVSHLFRFNGPSRRGITTVSYYQALDAANALPPNVFRDKHVLVGRSLAATSLDGHEVDHFPTPVAVQMPGVEVHATIVDALLRGRFVRDPIDSAGRYAALCAIAGASAAILFFSTGPAAGAAILAGLIATLVGAGYASLTSGLRLPVMGPSLAAIGAFVSTSAYRGALAARERRLIKRAFQHYVAPAIVERMLSDPSRLKLGGEQYDVTVLFSDLEGSTTLGERLPPADLGVHLGEYFDAMLDVLLPEHGTLDKLIGDSIMMYFGCPLPDPDHAVRACRGALATQRRMAALNDRWGRSGLPRLRTRIGINSGPVIAGNMGTSTIFNYTIIGDSVNLASRLEAVNKEYGTTIIVGEETWRRTRGGFEGRELDWIRVKGRKAPVGIYELAAEAGQLDATRAEVFRQFADGLGLYRAQRWTEAAAAFRRALDRDPQDGPSRTFKLRCEAYQRRPPLEWDGVHLMGS
jgi:adenylate cyclase